MRSPSKTMPVDAEICPPKPVKPKGGSRIGKQKPPRKLNFNNTIKLIEEMNYEELKEFFKKFSQIRIR